LLAGTSGFGLAAGFSRRSAEGPRTFVHTQPSPSMIAAITDESKRASVAKALSASRDGCNGQARALWSWRDSRRQRGESNVAMRIIGRVAFVLAAVTTGCQSPATKSSGRSPVSASDTAPVPSSDGGVPSHGDSAAGVAFVTEYDGFSVVFNHGRFVGVIYNFNGRVRAYRYARGNAEMHASDRSFSSIRAAADFLGTSPLAPEIKARLERHVNR
jgi:hypothetical protein